MEKYRPTVIEEIDLVNLDYQTVKYQSITLMNEYKNSSFEELRYKHYFKKSIARPRNQKPMSYTVSPSCASLFASSNYVTFTTNHSFCTIPYNPSSTSLITTWCHLKPIFTTTISQPRLPMNNYSFPSSRADINLHNHQEMRQGYGFLQ